MGYIFHRIFVGNRLKIFVGMSSRERTGVQLADCCIVLARFSLYLSTRISASTYLSVVIWQCACMCMDVVVIVGTKVVDNNTCTCPGAKQMI